MAGNSAQLAAMIAATAGKALQLLAEKAEYMAATGPDVGPSLVWGFRILGLCLGVSLFWGLGSLSCFWIEALQLLAVKAKYMAATGPEVDASA